jgi:hypothetical protein
MLVGHHGCHSHGSPAHEGLFWSLPASVLPVCVWSRMLLMQLLLLLFLFLNSKGDFWVAGVIPR